MVLGSKKEISRCSLIPAHARCYNGDMRGVLTYQCCLASLQLGSRSRLVYELDNKDQEELQERTLPQVSCIWSNVLLLRRGLAKSQVHVYLEKRTILPGFRNITSAEYVHRKTTQLALKKRWTNETVSIAAIFSRCCSRVEKTQAFEDGLTEGEVPETGVGRFRSLSQTDRTKL